MQNKSTHLDHRLKNHSIIEKPIAIKTIQKREGFFIFEKFKILL